MVFSISLKLLGESFSAGPFLTESSESENLSLLLKSPSSLPALSSALAFGYWSSLIFCLYNSIFSVSLIRTLSSRIADQISSKPSNSSVFYSVIWNDTELSNKNESEMSFWANDWKSRINRKLSSMASCSLRESNFAISLCLNWGNLIVEISTHDPFLALFSISFTGSSSLLSERLMSGLTNCYLIEFCI